MKINYVSVMKKYDLQAKKEKYIIRGALDLVPPPLWFKHLQLLWICSPKLIDLCPEPLLKNNEIIVSISNQDDILETIGILKSLVSKVSNSYIIQSEHALFLNFKESFM